jgi:hypothetical protein
MPLIIVVDARISADILVNEIQHIPCTDTTCSQPVSGLYHVVLQALDIWGRTRDRNPTVIAGLHLLLIRS